MTEEERVLTVEATTGAAIAILKFNLLGDPGIGLICPECGDWHGVEIDEEGTEPGRAQVRIGPVCEKLYEETDEARVLTTEDLEEENRGG